MKLIAISLIVPFPEEHHLYPLRETNPLMLGTEGTYQREHIIILTERDVARVIMQIPADCFGFISVFSLLGIKKQIP